jgi:hypothetical protein
VGQVGKIRRGKSCGLQQLQERVKLWVNPVNLIQLLQVGHVAPNVGERLLGGVGFRLEDDVVVPLRVERRVNVDEIN